MDLRIRGIPGAVLRRARARADDEGQDISTVLITALTVYADRDEPSARAGRASAAALTRAERSERASRAAQIRWQRVLVHSEDS